LLSASIANGISDVIFDTLFAMLLSDDVQPECSINGPKCQNGQDGCPNPPVCDGRKPRK
jgi:hypothetical protein